MADREPPDSSALGRLERLEALDELLPMLSGVLDVREVFVAVSHGRFFRRPNRFAFGSLDVTPIG